MTTSLAGSRIRREGRAAVLVVGHGAGKHLWGSERSLLDVLDGFQAIDIDVVVVVPPGVRDNPHYLRTLCKRACAVHIEHLPWRQCGQAADGMVTRRLSEIITHHEVSAVHVNTVVLREPLLAARQCGVPAVVHAREILHGNAELCGALAGNAENLVSEILADADFVIGNSRATAYTYPLSGRTLVVPNIIDSTRFTPRLRPSTSAPRVVLAGRLTATKGIEEFRLLASQLGPRCDARFIAVGPASPVTMAWASEALPDNLEFSGYLTSPENIMALADVVVCMSTVPESFGRTLVEAMAAGLPVVAWREGGPAEIVVHGETGFLVPPGDLDAFTHAVHTLCVQPELRQRMGRAGRRRVEDHFSPTQLARALRETYRTILPGPEVVTESKEIRRLMLPTENRSHFKYPFFVGCRARFAHCTDVAFLDERTLITMSLLGRRAYLVNFDPATGSSAFVAEIPTAAFAAECSADLLDTDGLGRIVMADCERQSVTLYRRVGSTLNREKTISVPAGGFCHGVCFIPGEPDRVAVSVTSGDIGVHVVSLSSGSIEWSIRLPGWRPKSAAFLTPERAVVAWARDNVGDRPGTAHDSQLTLMRRGGEDFSMELVASEALPGRSVDGLRMFGDRVFEPDQIKDVINEWRVDAKGFRLEKIYRGFSFPHGVGVSPDGTWLAVAEYGTNAIAFRPLRSMMSHSYVLNEQIAEERKRLPPPYVVHVEPETKLIPEGVFFSLEAPLPNAVSEGLVIEVAGWFAQTKRCALPTPEEIAVFVDGELWLKAPIDIPRPDVGPALLADTGETITTHLNGFSFLLPVHLSSRADAVYELAVLHGPELRALYPMVSLRFATRETPREGGRPRDRHPDDILTPVLITSLGRSGSSLLCRMLAAHPECYVGQGGGQFGELRVLEFLTRLMMVASSEGSLAGLNPFESKQDFNSLLPPAFASTLVGGPALENAVERALLPVMRDEATSFSCNVLVHYFENIRARQAGARFLIEKCWNSASVNALGLLCETVREVFLVRHPRELQRSDSAFARKQSLTEDAQRQRWVSLADRYIALARAWRDRRTNACLIRYEDLLATPAATLTTLLRYFGGAEDPGFMATAIGMVGDDSAHAEMLKTASASTGDVEFESYLAGLDDEIRRLLIRAAEDWGYTL